MTDSDAILFANEAFYRAFADQDLKGLEALWADDAPVLCLHPGWPPLIGYEDVIDSFVRILEGGPPDIQMADPQVFRYGDTALVVCYEVIGNDRLIATNGFVQRGHIWRMVHHQAGPTMGVPEDQPEESGPVN